MNKTYPAKWAVMEGAAQITIDSAPCTMELVPKNFSLPKNEDGFLVSVDVTFLESINMDRNVLFLWDDADNWYDIKVTNNEIRLQKVVAGVSYELENSVVSFPFEPDVEYHLEVAFAQNQIQLTIDDQLVLSTVDTEPLLNHQSATIGLQAGVGNLRRTASRFDNLLVFQENSLSQQLVVPSLKQSDPLWANLEYDHASEWSTNPTIQDWGCALTSMVMILRAHQIGQFADGLSITPETLNTWLLAQPDGYVDGGLLNFIAVTRLTKQLGGIFNTPSLEYNKVGWKESSGLLPAITELQFNRPLIVQIPGHFLVATNVTADQSDLVIHDPAYSYDTLSQHDVDPVSFRTFYPSHTDLSYILLTHSPSLEIQTTVSGQPILLSSTTDELISAGADAGGAHSPTIISESLAKPNPGEYQLTATNISDQTDAFSLFTYDQNGEVTTFAQISIEAQASKLFELQYYTDHPSLLTEASTFERFRQHLESAFLDGNIQTPITWWWLDHTTELAINADQRDFYQELLNNLIAWYSDSLTPQIKTQLLAEIAIIRE
ncbi:hypothetical protein KC921_03910 [Candidatus Woesebacteria bacterium]|nr:hypothetical protein [Candidatus Woesebacteria bacterium]